MDSRSVVAIIVVAVLITVATMLVFCGMEKDAIREKNKAVISLYDGLIEDYDEVVALQDIRIDQLKTQLEDCTGFYYGVELWILSLIL